MLAIGLLLILVAAAVTVGFAYDGGHDGKFDVFGQHITLNTPGAFLTGILTMLVFLLGVWMLISSMGRSRRRRAERKQTRARQRESVSKIEEERAQLRAENERLQEKLASDTRPASTTGAAAGTGAHAAPDGTTSGSTDRAGSTDATTGATVVGSDETHVDGSASRSDRATDLTSRDEPATSTSGRPRDEV